MQNFWGVKEVHYGVVQVVNEILLTCYTVLTRPNKVETAVHGCKFGLYHVVTPLSFLRSISLASLFAIPSIFG